MNEEIKKLQSDLISRFKMTRIERSDSFMSEFIEYVDRIRSDDYRKFFAEKIFSVKDTGVSNRTINNWDQNDLIEDEREEKSNWRKFSFIELTWIRIIAKLREFGLPLEKIHTTKESLINFGDVDKDKPFHESTTLFEFYLFLIISKQEPVYILVYLNGSADLATYNQLTSNISYQIIDSYLTIRLNKIVNQLLPSIDTKPVIQPKVHLLDDELDLVLALRDKSFTEIRAIKKDGKIDRIELSRDIDPRKKLGDLIKEDKYQDIQLTMQQGRIVSITKLLRKKF